MIMLLKSISLERATHCISFLVIWIVLTTHLLAVQIPKRTPEQIRNALVRHRIVPQLVDSAPMHAIEVAYGEKVVDFGNNFTQSEIENEPTHIKWPADKDSLYTLILTGPDVPTDENPEDKECQHWIVGNIPGTELNSGYNLTEYRGILTFYEHGTHRLIFLVYKQSDEEPIKFEEKRREKKITGYMRAFFHFNAFASKYHLEEPIAANFLLVQIDAYPYNLSSVTSANKGVYDNVKSAPLTSNDILAKIHQKFLR